MMSSAPSAAIRNVLVALDDTTIGRDTMEAAVHLAADLEADLQGLYFENDTLLRAAQLPFVHEVTTGSGSVRPIDARSLQRAMASKAEEVRRILEHWAESAQIRCSFAVMRERAMRRSLLSTSEADVVFFACRSHAPSVRRPIRFRPKSAPRPLLLVLDDLRRGDRVLTAATAVARNHSYPIILLVLARSAGAFQQLGSAASQRLCDQELAHTLLPQPITTPGALIRSARDQRPGLIVLSRQCELMSAETIDSMVDQLDCPVVLV